MKIAVTYENGQVFQHFGRTECFKLYEVEEGKIVSSELIDPQGAGHGALARILAEHQVNVLICGGIGGGAQSALAEAGIMVCAGAEGDTDAAVTAYLNGELADAGVTCHHHGKEEHSCENGGCGEQWCGHAEGHSCGGCGQKPRFEGPNVGKTCKVHYRGTFTDGVQFDSSYDRGEPLEFICGAGMMILGFDKAVATMEVGQVLDVHLLPEEAYGPSDPNAIFTLEIAQLPGSEDLELGQQVYLYNTMGQPIPVKVVGKTAEAVTFDANHEMAGKELIFRIELVSVQ